jgi:subtilisin family serine protease
VKSRISPFNSFTASQHNQREPSDPVVRSLLRQAGMLRIYCQTEGNPAIRIALIDGAIAKEHPSLAGAQIVDAIEAETNDPRCHSVRHGTFSASMLVGRGHGVMSLCPACTLLSVPAVSEAMVQAKISATETARQLARAVRRALAANPSVIQLSLEFHPRYSDCFQILGDALADAAARGVRTVIPAGNYPTLDLVPLLATAGVIPVAIADWNGTPYREGTFGAAVARGGLMAPGIEIPGAEPPTGFVERSGSSFSATFVTGAFALLAAVAPGKNPDLVWEMLLARYSNGDRTSAFIPKSLNIEGIYATSSN